MSEGPDLLERARMCLAEIGESEDAVSIARDGQVGVRETLLTGTPGARRLTAWRVFQVSGHPPRCHRCFTERAGKPCAAWRTCQMDCGVEP